MKEQCGARGGGPGLRRGHGVDLALPLVLLSGLLLLQMPGLLAAGSYPVVTVYYVLGTSGESYLVPCPSPCQGCREALRRRNARGGLWSSSSRDLAGESSGWPGAGVTRVLGCKLSEGTLDLSLSHEVRGAHVGSRGEALLLSALVVTAGQFPGVERVRLLVEGQAVDSLAGHVEVREPVAVAGALDHFLFSGFPDLRGQRCERVATGLSLLGVVQGRPSGKFVAERINMLVSSRKRRNCDV